MPSRSSALIPAVLDAARGGGLRPHDRVVVGVSGGADSTALACLLAALRAHGLPLELVLVYVDHGWRGGPAADRDAAAVEALARRLGAVARRAPPPPAGTPQSEDAARRHRYAALARAARRAGAGVVAVGHHVGDQAETLVMRVLCGSGPYGLAGIPAHRALGDGGLVLLRPLLALHPDALRAYLETERIAWREDPTNADPSRTRAAIRARLARFTAAGDDPRTRLAALTDRFRRRIARRDEHIANRIMNGLHVYPFAGAVRASRAGLRSLGSRLDLELALRTMGRALAADRHGPWLTGRVLRAIRDVVMHGGAVDLPRGLRVHVSGKSAWLAWRDRPELGMPLPEVEVADLADVSFSTRARGARRAPCALLDGDVLGNTPRLRRLRDDDTFVPFGSRSGRVQNVMRWLSKQGTPALARRGLLVLEGRTGVAWIVGERIDARHAVTPQTRRALRVQVPPH